MNEPFRDPENDIKALRAAADAARRLAMNAATIDAKNNHLERAIAYELKAMQYERDYMGEDDGE